MPTEGAVGKLPGHPSFPHDHMPGAARFDTMTIIKRVALKARSWVGKSLGTWRLHEDAAVEEQDEK